MITDECIDAYNKLFPQNGMAIYYEAGIGIGLGNFIFLIPPETETIEIFMDRLKRSKEQNKNLFLEEWEKFIADPDVKY